MKNFFKKKKHIDYSAENLAVPEVFVDDDEQTQEVQESLRKNDSENDSVSDDEKDEVIFDNLAVPEINIRRKRRK